MTADSATATQAHVRRAERAAENRHPTSDFPIKDGATRAMPHALLALVAEQQATNAHLASIADSLARIARQVDPEDVNDAVKGVAWWRRNPTY